MIEEIHFVSDLQEKVCECMLKKGSIFFSEIVIKAVYLKEKLADFRMVFYFARFYNWDSNICWGNCHSDILTLIVSDIVNKCWSSILRRKLKKHVIVVFQGFLYTIFYRYLTSYMWTCWTCICASTYTSCLQYILCLPMWQYSLFWLE